jgi:hypothetical protein
MTGEREPAAHEWVDDEAGPVVRPYAVTGGRAHPEAGTFDLISLVTATRADVESESGLGPEHVAIVGLCQQVQSVAEIAAHLDLPVGAVRVLLGDLATRDLVRVREPSATPAGHPDASVFEAVLNGLRAL